MFGSKNTKAPGQLPHPIISGTWQRRPTSSILSIILTIICLTATLYYLGGDYSDARVVDPVLPVPARSKEAYVIFLPDAHGSEYLLSARTLLFGLKHDSETRDPFRDVVVLTTPHVPFEVEDQLRKEGAIIERHEHITAIPNPYDIYGDNRWKDVLNKLFVFNMTHYERVLCLDADICLNKALTTFWDTPESWPEHGLAARSGAWEDHPSPPGHCKDELNSGFFLAVPSNHLFENLLQVKDFGDWDVEQSLLNKYFAKDGPHPWTCMGEQWIANWPQPNDITWGIHLLHEKFWEHGLCPREISELWRGKVGRMEGYWQARDETAST